MASLTACHSAQPLPLPSFADGEETMVVFAGADGPELRVYAVAQGGDDSALTDLRLSSRSPLLQVVFYDRSLGDLDLGAGRVPIVSEGRAFDFERATRRLLVTPDGSEPIGVESLPFAVVNAHYPATTVAGCPIIALEWSMTAECPGSVLGPLSIDTLDDHSAIMSTRGDCLFAIDHGTITRLSALEAVIAGFGFPPGFEVQSAWRSPDGRLWLGGRDRTLIEISGDVRVAPVGRVVVRKVAVNGEQSRHQLMDLDGSPDASEIWAPSFRGDLIHLTTTGTTPGFTTTEISNQLGTDPEPHVAWLTPGVAIATRYGDSVMVAHDGVVADRELRDFTATAVVRVGPDDAVLSGHTGALYGFRPSTGEVSFIDNLPWDALTLVPFEDALLYGGTDIIGGWAPGGGCGHVRLSPDGARFQHLAAMGDGYYAAGISSDLRIWALRVTR